MKGIADNKGVKSTGFIKVLVGLKDFLTTKNQLLMFYKIVLLN